MTPELSAHLHAMGQLSINDAMWVYGSDGYPIANRKAIFKDGEVSF